MAIVRQPGSAVFVIDDAASKRDLGLMLEICSVCRQLRHVTGM